MESYANRQGDTSAKTFSLDYLASEMPRAAVVVGFVVSAATWADLQKRFPPSKKKPRAGDTFNAVAIVVDPEAAPKTCEAFYDRAAFAKRCAAIATAPEVAT